MNFFFLVLCVACLFCVGAQRVFDVQFEIGEEVTALGFHVNQGHVSSDQEDLHHLVVRDENGALIYSVSVTISRHLSAGVPPECFDENLTYDKSCDALEYGLMSETMILRKQVPYDERAHTIELLDKNDTVLASLDVSGESRFCGDDICTVHESADLCPEDCSVAMTTIPIPNQKRVFNWSIILILIVLLGGISLVWKILSTHSV